MIKEIINFTNNLSADFKQEGVKPREGLHIVLKVLKEDGRWNIDIDTEKNYQYEIYSKKMEGETEFIQKCKFLSQNAWYIDSNKSYDKGIHTASPYCVAFKRELLEGGGANVSDREKNKREIPSRFEKKYFSNVLEFLDDNSDIEKCLVFQDFFVSMKFTNFISKIDNILKNKENEINDNLEKVKSLFKYEKNKELKEKLKLEIEQISENLTKVKQEGDYVIFYLDEPIEKYKAASAKYFASKGFNTDAYNTAPNEEGLIFGTSNFMNGFNGNMPFLTHQTASFDITGRISNKDAKDLFDFQQILARGVLPKPLPFFIYKEELQAELITLFKESGFKMGFVEMVESLWDNYKEDFKNYYFLYWQNTKEGIVFQDFDFVSQFEYELEAEIQNLFGLKEKGSKGKDEKLVHYPKINNVFEFEKSVLGVLIGVYSKDKNANELDYFTPLEGDIKKRYTNNSMKFIAYAKYRKAVYDFVYKSKRQGIDARIFSDMVFSHIKDDIKNDNGYGVKDKLNIWFSLYEKFDNNNKNNTITMASKLKDYQDFVAKLAVGQADLDKADDTHFAFAAGQVIEYVIQKSKTDNRSYQLLEPYLQQSKCSEFKKALANDIARYKHAINDNEWRFKSVCAFVQTWDTERNMKELLPEILAGVFAKNEFFTTKIEKEENKN